MSGDAMPSLGRIFAWHLWWIFVYTPLAAVMRCLEASAGIWRLLIWSAPAELADLMRDEDVRVERKLRAIDRACGE
jgi:hypothetical protein